ncbi:hypothetical protein [Bdellovibrio svalbardensis]|uniref:Uncharacterized protein n=1 Tax=Bdellovibrio svalbardensis TaxID=2972972 RepID=A0ABT6DLE5_9BACT|nr:hypothetical protein [Bdellovibrio svalbardensis]MDG0815943.1 hypothetical protein [Bdellovibrio svalbardensis]
MLRQLSSILSNYLEGFKVSNNGKLSWKEILYVFGTPALISIIITKDGPILSSNEIANIISTASIFIGFLINILVPFFTFIESQDAKVPKKILSETYDARVMREKSEDRIKQYQILFGQVTFSIFSALLTLLFLFSSSQFPLETNHFLIYDGLHLLALRIFKTISDFLFYFFGCLSLVNVLKILISANVLIYPRLRNPQTK